MKKDTLSLRDFHLELGKYEIFNQVTMTIQSKDKLYTYYMKSNKPTPTKITQSQVKDLYDDWFEVTIEDNAYIEYDKHYVRDTPFIIRVNDVRYLVKRVVRGMKGDNNATIKKQDSSN